MNGTCHGKERLLRNAWLGKSLNDLAIILPLILSSKTKAILRFLACMLSKSI
jgi:hypothetical protein